jgi:hypothetical protein
MDTVSPPAKRVTAVVIADNFINSYINFNTIN